MEDEMNRDALQSEMSEDQSQLDSLRLKQSNYTPRAMRSLFVSSLHLLFGLIFLSLFFFSLSVNMGKLFTTVFFVVSFLGLFPFLTDIFTNKDFISLRVLGGIVLAILAGGYVFLWMRVLENYLYITYLVLSVLFFLGIFFFLVHAYIAYLKRIAQKELTLLSIIAGIGFLLFLTQIVYQHFLLITLYLIIIGLFIKGLLDLTERFRK